MKTLNELELEYYLDPADIFPDRDGEGTKAVIKLVMLPKLGPEERELKIVLTEILHHPDLLETIEEYCKHAAMDSKALWDYTNNYRVWELKEKRDFWRTFISVVEEAIRKYFQKPAENSV